MAHSMTRALRPLSIGFVLGSGLIANNHTSALSAPKLAPHAALHPSPNVRTVANRPRSVDGQDTAAVHRELRKAIEKFQNTWRKVWEKDDLERHGYINLANIRGYQPRADGVVTDPVWEGDRATMNLTPDLRRYLAILCNIDSPTDGQIEAWKSGSRNNIGSQGGFAASSIAADRIPGGAMIGSGKVIAGSPSTDVNFVTSRLIQTTPNFGGICPSWIPPDERIPLDEGEAIDLAITVKKREPLRRDREVLIRVIADAHAKYPKDDWITGQLVRFTIDQRSPTRMVEAAQSCQGSEELCARYLGLAEQHANNFPAAEAAYRHADSLKQAAVKPDSAGCMDKETLLVLDHDDKDEAVRLNCKDQGAFEERMWWLADPLWSVKGNERYVEHNSRRVHATLRAVLDRDERYVWERLGGGAAMRELVIRYGWPGYTYWPGAVFEGEVTKVRDVMIPTRFVLPPYTAKEYSYDRTALIPAGKALRNPLTAKPEDFQLVLPEGKEQDQWWPREHMMLWTKVQPMAVPQEVQWRRDTTILYEMAVDHPISSLDTGVTGPSPAALMASTGRDDIRTLYQTAITLGQTLRMSGEFSSKPFVISAEVNARSIREPARRLRYGVHPPPTLSEMKADEHAISDPVVLQLPARGGTLPNTPAMVKPFIAGSLELSRNDNVALYWESYGFSPTDSVNFELKINRRDDVNVARRIGSALGIVSDLRDSVSIKWSEPDARNGGAVIAGLKKSTIGRSISLDLKSLPPGEYLTTIVMSRSRSVSVQSQRRFTLK